MMQIGEILVVIGWTIGLSIAAVCVAIAVIDMSRAMQHSNIAPSLPHLVFGVIGWLILDVSMWCTIVQAWSEGTSSVPFPGTLRVVLMIVALWGVCVIGIYFREIARKIAKRRPT